ncbi:MAG: integrase arm-type DNA-binding domain-containing protein [Pseudomonadota bacterium]
MSKKAERGIAGINQDFVDHAPAGTHTIGDGLILKVRRKGDKEYGDFILRVQSTGQNSGKRKDFQMGSRMKVRLKEAKAKAAIARRAYEIGGDPLVAIGKKKATPKGKDFRLRAVMERKFKTLKPTLKDGGQAGRWLSPVEQHVLPKLGSELVTEIDSDAIEDGLKKVWVKAPSTAIKAFRRLKMALEYASDEGADVDLPGIDAAFRRLGPLLVTKDHIASTPYADIPALYARLCEKSQTIATLAFRLVILNVPAPWASAPCSIA